MDIHTLIASSEQEEEARTDRNRSPSTIARTGPSCCSRAWEPLTPTTESCPKESTGLNLMKNALRQQRQPSTDRAHCRATISVPFQDSGCSTKRTRQAQDDLTNRFYGRCLFSWAQYLVRQWTHVLRQYFGGYGRIAHIFHVASDSNCEVLLFFLVQNGEACPVDAFYELHVGCRGAGSTP